MAEGETKTEINLTIKTAKDKKQVTIAVEATVDQVCEFVDSSCSIFIISKEQAVLTDLTLTKVTPVLYSRKSGVYKLKAPEIQDPKQYVGI